MNKTVLQLDKVYFAYDRAIILENISITIKEKDFVVIVGPNGGGKTTLLKIIMGFLKPIKGKVKLFGKPPYYEKSKIGYVPQFGEYDKNFPLSALDVVLTGLLTNKSVLPWYTKRDKNRALNMLEKVGIVHLSKEKIGKLSGGQKQRVLIARALISEPEILLLDEPTASIDPKVERHIYELLKELNKKITIMLVTHDVAFVSHYAKTIACLNKRISVNTVKKTPGKMESYYHTPMDHISHDCEL